MILHPLKRAMSRLSSHSRYRPGDCIRHPMSVFMLWLWLLNDHVFKDLWGNALTGKLSDISGLVVFPLMLVATYELICAYRQRVATHLHLVLWLSLGISAMIIILINMSDWGADFCRISLGLLQWPFRCLWSLSIVPIHIVHLTMDPTDLWTLGALFIPYTIVSSRLKRDIEQVEKR